MKWERAPVLALASHFAARPDDLRHPGLQVVGDVPVVLLPIGTRHQQLDVLTKDLGRRVPEQPFCGRVERLDESLGIDHDDAVYGRREDGLEDGFHLAWKLKW